MNTYNEYDNPAFSRIDARDRLGPKISQNTSDLDNNLSSQSADSSDVDDDIPF